MITREDLDAIRGVEGGLKAFAEEALERSLGLGPSDRAGLQGPLHPALQPAGRRDADDLAGTAGCPGEVPGTVRCRSPRWWRRPCRCACCARTSSASRGPSLARIIRLGHDALAKVAAAWQAERDEEERLQQERAQVERERKKRRQQIRKLVVGDLPRRGSRHPVRGDRALGHAPEERSAHAQQAAEGPGEPPRRLPGTG